MTVHNCFKIIVKVLLFSSLALYSSISAAEQLSRADSVRLIELIKQSKQDETRQQEERNINF